MKKYESSDIAVLSEIEHIQLNPSMYIRKTEDDEPSHLIEECLDNALDEAQAGFANIIAVTIDTEKNKYSVIDNGRGIPLEKNTPVTISTKLFSGAKFQDRKTAYQINSGLHGVGLVAVLALSENYEINVYRNKKHGNYVFKNAKLKSKSIKDFKDEPPFSTCVSFIPSSKYFDQLIPDIDRIRMRLITASVGLPNCTFALVIDDKREVIKVSKEDVFKQYTINNADKKTSNFINITSEIKPEKFDVLFAYSFSGSNTPRLISSVNLLPVNNGGTHVNILFDILKEYFTAKAKKKGIKVLANDCLIGLRAYLNLSLKTPEFAGQAKERLTVKKRDLEKYSKQLKDNLELYFNEHDEELITILSFFEDYRKNIDAKRLNNGAATRKRGFSSYVKLRDCSSPRGELFIVEGDSAGGGLIQSRDPKKHAIFPLKGKIPSAASSKDILKNKEIGELIMALGTGVHQQFNIKNLRYSKIICATDADPDGSHIASLLILAFTLIIPEVIKQGRFYIAQTPLYAIDGKNEFIPLWTQEELEIAIKNNKSISRYKGLGELEPHNLKVCLLDDKTRHLHQVEWTNDLDSLVKLFSNVESKRELLAGTYDLKEKIADLYRDYGMYVNQSRQLPLSCDGLKPVERRLLFSANEVCKEKFIKSASLDGHCMGRYHPHSSSYGTIVQLVKQGFLEGHGIFGTSIGTEPVGAAAMRYTKVKQLKETYDIALSLIKYVDMIEGELPDYKEPEFLPTMIPLCLIGKYPSMGIGFGYRTYIPTYRKEDLVKRLMWLLKITKEKPTIYPISECKYIKDDEAAEQLLTTGSASLRVKGRYRIDKINKKLILHSWPSNKTFPSLIKGLKDISYMDLSCDKSGTLIEIGIDRQRGKDAIFKGFLKVFLPRLNGTEHYQTYVIEDHNVTLKSIDQWLLDTYEQYNKIYMKMLSDVLDSHQNYLNKLKLIKLCRPYIASYISNNKKISTHAAADYISKEIKIPKTKILELFTNHNISYLLSADMNEKSVLKKIEETNNQIKNINEIIISKYQNL